MSRGSRSSGQKSVKYYVGSIAATGGGSYGLVLGSDGSEYVVLPQTGKALPKNDASDFTNIGESTGWETVASGDDYEALAGAYIEDERICKYVSGEYGSLTVDLDGDEVTAESIDQWSSLAQVVESGICCIVYIDESVLGQDICAVVKHGVIHLVQDSNGYIAMSLDGQVPYDEDGQSVSTIGNCGVVKTKSLDVIEGSTFRREAVRKLRALGYTVGAPVILEQGSSEMKLPSYLALFY